MIRSVLIVLSACLFSFATAQGSDKLSAEELVNKYVTAFNTDDVDTLASMFDNPASQRQIELYAPPMVKRYRIDPSSVQLTVSGYGKADVYLTYLAEKGAPKVSKVLLFDWGEGYKMVYSDLPVLLKQERPLLGFYLDVRQNPEFLPLFAGIGLFLGPVTGVSALLARRERRKVMFRYNRKAFKPSDESWLLAVAAIYRAFWDMPLDKLSITNDGHFAYLQQEWTIHSREDLIHSLMWFYHEGYRDKLLSLSDSFPDECKHDLLAWDLVCFIILTLTGLSTGYLQPAEAEAFLRHGNTRLQAGYKSWEEMATAFQAGRFLWRRYTRQPISQDVQSYDNGMDAVIRQLLGQRDSPWKKIPWNTTLSTPAANDFFSHCTAMFMASQQAYVSEKLAHLN